MPHSAAQQDTPLIPDTPEAPLFAAWGISAARHQHEWMRLRRVIVAARIRFVIYGHMLFFLGCLVVRLTGAPSQYPRLIATGWWSLGVVSAALLAMEYLHIRLRPDTPPRFVIRSEGLTEYHTEGPRAHWGFSRISSLDIVSDPRRPDYRSLVLCMSRRRLLPQKLHRCFIPLPDDKSGEVNELHVIAALGRALNEKGIGWQKTSSGGISLQHDVTYETTKTIFPQFASAWTGII